jgi:hypothetical protein
MKRTLALLVLVGCAHSHAESEPFHGPTGELGYEISCSGSDAKMADCYEEAHKLCGGPYTISKQEEKEAGIDTSGNGSALFPTQTHVHMDRELTVICTAGTVAK